MEPDNSMSAIFTSPEVNIVLFGKVGKNLDSRVHPLFFGDCVKERTYTG
jgi:hypothetical protein